MLIVTKMPKLNLKDEIVVPEGVEVLISPPRVSVKGPKGQIERMLFNPYVKIKSEEGKVILEIKNAGKHEKMFMKTFKAHIKNMVNGVVEGYSYKLKICSGHFPMTVKHEQNKIIVSNFLGEKIPRVAVIPEGVEVEIKKDEITLAGINKEIVGQAAANIEKSTKITKRDRRKFQDGIYITQKAGAKI